MLRRLLLGSVRPSRTSCLSTLAETNSSEAEEISYPAYDTPTIVSRNLEFPTKDGRSRKAWVENLDSVAERKLGMVDLHPEIFAVPPRLDMIWANIRWQELYKKVNLVHVNNRAEMIGGGRKPWQQKGLGRARQGSIRAPQWVNGGSVNGPRSPTSWFYMLPIHTRLYGLRSVLSIKLAQDDLHIVNSLDIPTNEPSFLEDLAEERQWGPSVLFVDDTDYALENIAVASDKIKHMNLMPVYGLNVYSMLKHDTLVLTLAALDRIEKQMLYFMNRTDRAILGEKFRASTV